MTDTRSTDPSGPLRVALLGDLVVSNLRRLHRGEPLADVVRAGRA
jgi:hypothetical protein